MNTISIINLKGGVGKTVTSINLAYMLAALENKKVLLIDNDKQGNSSKFFKRHGYKHTSLADILEQENYDIKKVIRTTQYQNLDILPANMNLMTANKTIMLDMSRQQQTILSKALETIKNEYTYCVIDNAPDINISVINALVASDHVVVPVKIDQFSLDGIEQLVETFDKIKAFNPNLNFAGVLVTMFAKNLANRDGCEWLHQSSKYPVFKTKITRTVKVDESTFVGKPLAIHSLKSAATKDYINFMYELLEKIK